MKQDQLGASVCKAASQQPSLANVESLGDYRIIRELGRGGMGIVFEAEQVTLKRHVAVKVLASSALLEDEHLRRFRREAQSAARLHHTNIVPVFGVGEQHGLHYYVMQFIVGTSLDAFSRSHLSRSTVSPLDETIITGDVNSDRPATSQPSQPEKSFVHESPINTFDYLAVSRIGIQAADALAYAHAHGVVHRDIKPANLMLDQMENLWITDFGLAKSVELEDVSRDGNVAGTLRYMPPERFSGRSDDKGDIYSLGLTLYELVAGRPAYDASDASRLFHQVTQSSPVPLNKLDGSVPRDLETIIAKAIDRDPDRRYESAAAMRDDLQRFCDGRPILARPIGPVERLMRWSQRNPLLAAVTFLCFLLAVTTAVVFSVAYVRTHAALLAEAEQRRQSERTLELAVDGFGTVMNQFVKSQSHLSGPEDSEAGLGSPISAEETAMLEKLLDFYDRLSRVHSQNEVLQDERQKAMKLVGEIQLTLGHYSEAEQTLGEAISSRVMAIPAGDLALIRMRTARALALRMLGRIDESTSEYRLAKEGCAALDLQQNDPEATFVYAQVLVDSWAGFIAPAIAESAESELRQAIQMLDGIRDKDGFRVQAKSLEARALRGLSLALARQNRRADAVEAMQDSFSLLEDLVAANPTRDELKYELATVYLQLDLSSPNVRAEVATRRFLRAEELANELCKTAPDSQRYQILRARSLFSLGAAYILSNRDSDAEPLIRDAIAVASSIYGETKNISAVKQTLAHSQLELAEILIRRNQTGEVTSLLINSELLYLELMTEFPQSERFRDGHQRSEKLLLLTEMPISK